MDEPPYVVNRSPAALVRTPLFSSMVRKNETYKFQKDILRGPYGEAMVVASSDSRPHSDKRIILYPHGGPHSAFSSAFSFHVAMLAMSNYVVVLCNYRGSVGYGEKSLLSLPSNIGTNDVDDCLQMCDAALEKGWGSKALKPAVMGGSHGGFLACMLTSLPKCADRFCAAIMRNPVTDLTTMVGTSDIEDWVVYEGGAGDHWPEEAVRAAGGEGIGAFPGGLRADDVVELLKRSPMQYVGNVKANTMVCLGENDRRVPPSQGLQWARRLKQKGDCVVETYLYPDNAHPLNASFATYHVLIKTAAFLRKTDEKDEG